MALAVCRFCSAMKGNHHPHHCPSICDNYDGAGPCGDGSFNDVPQGNSDCDEYFKCSEEISD